MQGPSQGFWILSEEGSAQEEEGHSPLNLRTQEIN